MKEREREREREREKESERERERKRERKESELRRIMSYCTDNLQNIRKQLDQHSTSDRHSE